MQNPDSSARLAAVRHIAWPALGVQFAALAISLLVCRLLLGSSPWSLLAGVLLYLLHARGARTFLLRHHAAGIAALRARAFQDAIREFEASYAFLSRHRWIDRHRTAVLLSPSRQSFREMALLNAAFAELQLGRAPAAKAIYQRVLDEFPASARAAAALRWLAAVERGA